MPRKKGADRTEHERAQDREAQRRFYVRNKERVLARNKAQRQRVADLIIQEKDKPCADCGVKYPSYVMDFDHVRGTKSGNIASMVFAGRGVKTILEEIAKCEVVCANCHRERTHQARTRTTTQLEKGPL